jgi:hypothetical protein
MFLASADAQLQVAKHSRGGFPACVARLSWFDAPRPRWMQGAHAAPNRVVGVLVWHLTSKPRMST